MILCDGLPRWLRTGECLQDLLLDRHYGLMLLALVLSELLIEQIQVLLLPLHCELEDFEVSTDLFPIAATLDVELHDVHLFLVALQFFPGFGLF